MRRVFTASASRRTMIVKVLVWLLLATVASVCFLGSPFSQAPVGTPEGHAGVFAAAVAPAAPQDDSPTGSSTGSDSSVASVNGVPIVSPVSQRMSGPIRNTYGCTALPTGDVQCMSPTNLLPAFRWSSGVSMPTNQGWGPTAVAVNGLTSIADILFTIAGAFWWLLLVVVRFAISAELLQAAAVQIDTMFSNLVGALGGSGVVIVAIIIVAAIVTVRLLKGRKQGAVSAVLAAVLVIGGMYGLSAAASGSGTAGGQSEWAGVNVGSPSWVALKGTQLTNMVSGVVSTGFGVTSSFGKSSTAENVDLSAPTCAVYNAKLVSSYLALSAERGSITHNVSANMTASTLAALSSIWQQTYYRSWAEGVFGNLAVGRAAVCHQLETAIGTPAVEQYAVVGGLLQNGKIARKPDAQSPGYEDMGLGPFVPTPGSLAGAQAVAFSWAACAGPDKVTPGWQPTFPEYWLAVSGVADEFDLPTVAPANAGVRRCDAWYNFFGSDVGYDNDDYSSVISWVHAATGKGFDTDYSAWGINSCEDCDENPALQGRSTSSIVWNGNPPTAGQPASHKEVLSNIQDAVSSFRGNNGAARMFSGFAAMVSAFLYGWCFGTAALGSLIAQIGLILLLLLLPFTLLLLAFPDQGGGRNKTGVKLLRTSAAFLGGKLLFLTLLCVMVQLLSILWLVVDSLTGASSQGLYVVWTFVVPIAAIFVLRLLTKAAGLGSITSLSGATGFATKAALGTSREGRQLNKNASQAIANSPVGRLAAKTRSAIKGAPRQGGRLALQAASAQKGRLGLSPAMAQQVAQGKMSYANAKAVDSGILNPSMAQALQNGRMGMAEAVMRSMTLGTIESRGKTSTGSSSSTPHFGGVQGALGRLEGAASPGYLPGQPGPHTDLPPGTSPFLHSAIRSGADAQGLRESLTAAENTLGQHDDLQGYNSLVAENIAARAERLRSGAQGVALGAGASLTPEQTATALRDFAEANGVREGQVLMSDSGLPPMLAPVTRDVNGALNFRADGTNEERLAEACNMASYLDLDVPSGATQRQVHMQTELTMQALGGISDTGELSYDFIKEHTGMDPSTSSGQREILVATASNSPDSALNRIELDLPYPERQAIHEYVYSQNDAPQASTSAAAAGNLAAGVQARAEQLQDSADVLINALESTGRRIGKLDPNSENFTESFRDALSLADRAPDLIADRLGAALEARIAGSALDTGGFNMDMANTIAAKNQEALDHLADRISGLSASAKVGDPTMQAAMFENIADVIEKSMSETQATLENEMRYMMSKIHDDTQRTLMHNLASPTGPRRAADLAAGASGLSSD